MNNRILGTIAMICAPAMLIELLIEEILLGGQNNVPITGVAGMVFMGGWICSNIVMQRMQATGTSLWGRAVLLIQLVGLVLAFMFGFFEATGLLTTGNIVWSVTDAAWPLSMLWMLVVGVSVLVAKRLSGWQRFVPILCPFWLPIAVLGSFFGDAAGFVGLSFGAILWFTLGYIVRESSEQPAPVPGPAVAG